MELKTAKAHLRILGFTSDAHNSVFKNERTGIVLLYIKNHWVHSLLTSDRRKTKKLANFLNAN